MNLSALSQPSLNGCRVPPGHILMHSKFLGGPVIKLLRDCGIKPIVQDGMGVVDFYPSGKIAIIWLPEETLIGNIDAVKKRLIKLDQGMCNGMVLAQVTQLSQQYFKELQSYAITEFDVSIVPIASTNEMVKFLVQQVYNQAHENPTLSGKKNVNIDDAVLGTLMSLPGVGKKKALELLKKYPSIHDLQHASTTELEKIVSRATVVNIHAFLDGKPTKSK